jgi:hypothetical protein
MEFATAQEALGFVQDQTLRINARVYATQYPELNYAELVPVNVEGPEWATGVATYITDSVGQAEWFAGGAKDMRLAEVTVGATEHRFHLVGIGYEFNLEEVNTAALINRPLTNQKADAARRAAESFIHSNALAGDTRKGQAGLINSAAVTSGLVANNAGATSRLWVNKTAAEIIADVNTVLTGIYTNTLTVEAADTLLLPIERLLYLGQTFMPNTTETLLSFVQRTNRYTHETGRPRNVRGERRLLTAGAGATARMVAYRRDPDVLEFHMPMPHRFFPVWQNGPMNFLVPGIFRIGGIEIKRPAAIRYADGF